jgi:hypothetical protein
MRSILALLVLFALGSAAAAGFANQGKVLDTMDASIYTYIQVSSDKGPLWLATTSTRVAKGDTINYPDDGVVMNNFTSKSLNRKFDRIIFIDKMSVLK